jgi:Flp pilus assembly protein TadB
VTAAPALAEAAPAVSLLAAGLAAAAVVLALRPAPRVVPARRLGRAAAPARAPAGDLLDRHRPLVAALAALGPSLLLDGVLGMAAGLVAGTVTWRTLRRREPASERRRRRQVAAGLPTAVDLLAVSLAAGSAPSGAVEEVAGAVGGPVAEELRSVGHGLRLGREPTAAWADLARRPGLEVLGRTMARAARSGASVSDAMSRLADDLHAAAASDVERRARAVGVRASAPLGVCFLPAFVLLGVVPLVVGTMRGLFG